MFIIENLEGFCNGGRVGRVTESSSGGGGLSFQFILFSVPMMKPAGESSIFLFHFEYTPTMSQSPFQTYDNTCFYD